MNPDTGRDEVPASDLLAAHPFFSGMPRAMLERVASSTTIVHHPAGSVIARTGGDADRFHAVVDGRAAIELTASDREPLIVATVHPGEVIGWSWFVEPHRWRFDVVALDEVCALTIDAAALRSACEADHELGYRVAHHLARVIAARLESTRHQLVDVYGDAR